MNTSESHPLGNLWLDKVDDRTSLATRTRRIRVLLIRGGGGVVREALSTRPVAGRSSCSAHQKRSRDMWQMVCGTLEVDEYDIYYILKINMPFSYVHFYCT